MEPEAAAAEANARHESEGREEAEKGDEGEEQARAGGVFPGPIGGTGGADLKPGGCGSAEWVPLPCWKS